MKRKIYKLFSSGKQGLFALALTLFSSTAFSQTTYTLNYTGGVQSLTLQAGSYSIECWGADGGAGGTTSALTGTGGIGGYSNGIYTLASPTTLYIYVGGKGQSTNTSGASVISAAGGWNGGGGGRNGATNTYYRGGGGGGSDVRTTQNTVYANRIIVAGGGGGAGGSSGTPSTWVGSGGNGGGTSGQNGVLAGSQTNHNGKGGTQSAGGAGGVNSGNIGVAGSFGLGGDGGGTSNAFPAGGGGGGWYGGGGGATQGGGGGGGSGYIGGVTSGTTIMVGQAGFVTRPNTTGNGMVIIKELCNISLLANGLSSLPALCTGNSITLTTNAVSNYSWSNSATTSSIVVSPTTTTTYSLGATSASNCTSSAAITITVSSSVPVLSVVNTASASGGICPTQTVQLTASGALSYSWSGGAIPVSNGVVFSPTSAVNYTVSGVNGCGTTTAVTSVSVHPFPTVNPVASTSTLCSGSSLTLTATGNATNYVWSGGSAPGNNGAGFVPAGSGITTYSVVGTSALSCTAIATVPTTVYPTPINAPIANPALICIGGSSTLSATGALNYTWTSSSQTVNTSDFVVTPSVGATTYTITKANSSCYNTQTISVVTNALPTIFAIVTPTVVCALSPATLAVGGAQTYTWTAPGSPSYTFTGASPIVSPVGPTTYSVAASDGTCINTSTVFLNANPNPTIVASASTPTTCGGEPVTLSATGGINYSWTSSGTATASTQSFTDAPTIPTAYYVTGDNSFGCTSGASQIVLVLPSPTITTSSAQPVVCSGAPVVVSASGAGSYTWSANAGGVTTNTALVNPTNTVSGPVTYTVVGTGATNICKSTQTVLVNVFVPTLAVGGNTNTCAGSSVSLTIIGGSSAWSWNTGSSTVNSKNVVAPLTAPAVFTLSAMTNSGTVNCPSTETVALGIYYNPTITAVAQRTAICRNESVDVTANGGISYVWNTGSTNTVLTVSPVGTIINYTVTGTDVNGCSSTASVQIKISGCVGVPELSANNDLTIYPNPNNGVFTIETNSAIQLNLVNELGQLVRVIALSDANNYKVSVNDLAQGIYFISGQKDEVQIYQKIVVTN